MPGGRPRLVVTLKNDRNERVIVRRRIGHDTAAEPAVVEPLIQAEKMRARWHARAAGIDTAGGAFFYVTVDRSSA